MLSNRPAKEALSRTTVNAARGVESSPSHYVGQSVDSQAESSAHLGAFDPIPQPGYGGQLGVLVAVAEEEDRLPPRVRNALDHYQV